MEKYKRLNSLIMKAAMSGKCDCTGPIDIHYKKIDGYVLVLIEEYTGDWHYRVFISDKNSHYERRYILDPIIGMDNLKCVYDCYWNIYSGKTGLRHLEEDWIEDVEAKVQAGMF